MDKVRQSILTSLAYVSESLNTSTIFMHLIIIMTGLRWFYRKFFVANYNNNYCHYHDRQK